ncbi:LemA family protein [Leptospira interrogans serovar Manilae]|uniref:LemA family protein n=1 Tax=Leptospira interrogans serovar Manilae TaxID=214675 RepID=A0AAQ1NWT6_LEPIR|nr:LemA family protein [Leptospira interrogans]AKP25376.1 LemA [Leptospira interrogans serovar Manilae]AKP29159.1 LemA [Leptospira interrogans serovar Manilae]EYU65057.1 LemA [Leptospira interrogans serovar Manilae]SOR60057.1 LemA family protein [Leptospira interrogans serovar Manilae]
MKTKIDFKLFLITTLTLLVFSNCGYNTIQEEDEVINASWAEILNQYQRRSDLIPNLVNTVKGYATQEEKVLIAVTKARAGVGSIQADEKTLNNPELFKKYSQAQAQMTSALSKLLVIAENYPELKSNENFRDLQAQLEGTENRITVARNRYIQAVQKYNVTIRKFPNNITAKFFGFETKPSFSVENEKEISKPPEVKF